MQVNGTVIEKENEKRRDAQVVANDLKQWVNGNFVNDNLVYFVPHLAQAVQQQVPSQHHY